MWWLRELLSSLKFLSVTGTNRVGHSKRVYEFLVPAAVTAVIFVIYLIWPGVFVPSFLSRLSSGVFQFLIFAVPFHLAALGAFATFNSDGLDKKLAGDPAQIRVWSNTDNGFFFVELTLRQYISLMFGYLCSIGVLFIAVHLVVSNLNFCNIFGRGCGVAEQIALFATIFFVIHYVTLTIYAITFLFDKVNVIRSP